jgi:hypothetical protein
MRSGGYGITTCLVCSICLADDDDVEYRAIYLMLKMHDDIIQQALSRMTIEYLCVYIAVTLRVKPKERNFMSCESRIFCQSLTSSQLILRRRVVQTTFLYETECSRNYATEISLLTTHKITLASPLQSGHGTSDRNKRVAMSIKPRATANGGATGDRNTSVNV